MKVLVLLHDYLPEHVGGTEVHAHQLAVELVQRGHAVTALFGERDPARPEGQLREGELDGVRTLEVVHQREYAALEDTWREPRALELFREQLAAEAPDLVHVQHFATWGAACLSAAREVSCAVVYTAHDAFALCANAKLLRRDLELCPGPLAGCADCLDDRRDLVAERLDHHRLHLASAQRVIAPSAFLGRRLADAGLVRDADLVHLRAGYPGERHPPRPAPAGRPLRLGLVGGLFPAKGPQVAIEVVRALTERGIAVELSLHGVLEWFPDFVDELRTAARGLPVDFVGRFEPREVDRVFLGLDLLLIPSLWPENLPLVAHEAFRCGVPLLASDLGGLPELLELGGGELLPAGDVGAWAARIEELAGDRERLFELACSVPPVPDLPAVAEHVEALYGECVAGR